MSTKTLLSDTSKNADIKRQILRLCIIKDNGLKPGDRIPSQIFPRN